MCEALKGSRERDENKKDKRIVSILYTFPTANLIFVLYSRCTQSPLQQKENMPKAKS